MPELRHVIVVGGGAAGLLASLSAAKSGARVTLLEKSERVGMKILISGGGKCNITHAGTIDEILRPFRRNEALFLKPSFYRFTNRDILTYLHERHIATYVRPDGRVFPVEPKNAKDVVAVLERMVQSAGVTIKTCAGATGISVDSGRVVGVELGAEIMPCDALIIAVGGSSYPATGTTGDGWRWAEALGHTVVPLRAALAPIYMEPARAEWSGVTLTDVKLTARIGVGGKLFTKWQGDLLFTHRGISGPCSLGISRDIADEIGKGSGDSIYLFVDLVHTLTYEQLIQSVRIEGQMPLMTVVQRYLPKRLADDLLYSLDLNIQSRVHSIPPKALSKLLSTIKEWPIGRVWAVPLERGEVVAGGVSLDEVDPKTMLSRLVPGLYLCGEILDIAGPVGGYNLQAAWSTGYVAGIHAATGP